MDIEKKLLKPESLDKLVQKLKDEGRQIFAPVKKETQVEFAQISSVKEMADDYIVTVQSAKAVAFPKVEKLFDFETAKDGVSISARTLEDLPEIVLLGVRPCDAFGFDSLNAIFTWDYKDHIFVKRLEKTTVIGMSCSKCDAYCFCTSVNLSPDSTKGSDILLTKIANNDYLAEIITEKGKAIVTKYPELFANAPEANKADHVAKVPVAFELEKVLTNLPKSFENGFWVEQSLRCIGCGACAYVCPTCACFDIQDLTNGKNGYRKRSWDSCGFALFTLHTSGHNPREVQSARWRQRVMHKYAYMPERQNVVGCVGCGRCSRSCPSDMNLKEHMINLVEEVTK